MTIKLAIVSSNRLFCEGVRKLVEGDPEIVIVGEPDPVADFRTWSIFKATSCSSTSRRSSPSPATL